MARRERKRLEKLQEQIHAWQTDSERTRQKELWSRIQAADQARIELEAGPSALKSVGFFQRLSDRLSAIFHSVMRLHVFCDPVAAYERSLRSTVTVLTSKARAAHKLRRIVDNPDETVQLESERLTKREDGTDISVADHLRAQIAFKRAVIDRLEQRKGASSRSLDDLMVEVNEEVAGAEKDYKQWYDVLQRPAYFEVFRTSAAPLSDSSSSTPGTRSDVAKAMPDQQQHKESRFARFVKALVGEYSAPILVPLEAFYSYAAFLLVTPNSPVLATAAALIFTLSLTAVGAGAAHFALRSFRHRVVPSSSPQPAGPSGAVESTTNHRMLWAAVAMAAVGVILIYGGADLRAKLPAVDVWTSERSEMESELSRLQSTQLQTDENAEVTAKRDARRAHLERQLVEHDKARQTILRVDFSISDSDEIVAIGIYFALFLAAAATYILKLDPYFEYGLLARYLSDVKTLKRNVRVIQELNERTIENQREEHAISLLDARTKLWLLDKNDPAGLSPYDALAAKDVREPQVAASPATTPPGAGQDAGGSDDKASSAASLDVSSSLGDAWVAERLARYARWYILFFGRSAEEKYSRSFQRAMELASK